MQFTDTGASFELRNDEQNDTIAENLYSVPFKVHMTGDMAWYAVAHGERELVNQLVLDLHTAKVRVAVLQLN
jgi:hypothetical protein